jgi:chromosome segregation ATPase
VGDLEAIKADIVREQGELKALEDALPGLQATLTAANNAVTKETAEVTRLDGEVNALVTKLAGINTQITAAENTILSLQNRLTPLQTSLNTLNTQISEKEAALTTAKADLNALDAKIVTQTATLRALESAKKVNRDAVAAQQLVVAGLQSQYKVGHGPDRRDRRPDRTRRLPRLSQPQRSKRPRSRLSWGASLSVQASPAGEH